MAGNIGMGLYLVIGKIKLALPNFNPPTLFYCIKKSIGALYAANIKSANI